MKKLIIKNNKKVAMQIKKYLTTNRYNFELALLFYDKINCNIDMSLLDLKLPEKL